MKALGARFANCFSDFVFPGSLIAAVCSFGLIADLLLHLASRNGILYEEPALTWFSIPALLCFWVTIGWAIYGCGRLMQFVESRLGKFAAGVVALGCSSLLTFALAVHIGSWMLNWQIGRFATIDVLTFLWSNPVLTMWDCMGNGERIALASAVLFAPLIIFGFKRLLTQVARVDDEKRFRNLRATWVLIFIVVVGAWTPIGDDLSAQRFSVRSEAVRSRLHPAVTMIASTYDRMTYQSIEANLRESDLVSRDTTWAPPENAKRPSVIFLAIEALRWDIVGLKHQGHEVAPNLNRLAKAGLTWKRAYAQATHSDYADVCIVSSLYPLRTQRHHYYRADDPWPKTLAFDLFKQAGYATAVMSSQNESWGGMDEFLNVPTLDLFFDSARSNLKTHTSWRDTGFAMERALGTMNAGSLYDNQTMDRTMDWIDEQLDSGNPYFVSMNLQSSHFPYELPPHAEHPFQPARLDNDVTFLYHPPEKTPLVKNCYLNAVHNCDRELGRLIDHLRERGTLEDTIVVVMGENGEAFHENGSVGHAREPVEPAVHVTTVFHGPKWIQPQTETYPLEHVDLLPTILGIIGWQPHPNLQGRDVLSPERPKLRQRLIFHHVNTAASRANAVQWAGRWKLIEDENTRTMLLYDLQSDPKEADNLFFECPEIAEILKSLLDRWRNNQLAYHRFPAYYQRYYPPQSPKLTAQQIDRLERAVRAREAASST